MLSREQTAGKNIRLVFALALLLSVEFVSAYLDPGTGSYILQLTLSGLLATAFTLKLYWWRIMRFLRRRSGSE